MKLAILRSIFSNYVKSAAIVIIQRSRSIELINKIGSCFLIMGAMHETKTRVAS